MTPDQLADEVDFWLLSQDREHNLFFALGLEDAGLRGEAASLQREYERAAAARDRAAALAIAPRSQEFKRRAYARASAGWVGWIFPTFIDHTRREIDYALARIAGRGPDARGEACFWNRIGAEHAAFAAHLADPTEAAAIRRAVALSGQLTRVHEQCMVDTMGSFVALSRQAAAELDAYFSGLDLARVRSVIHPALAAHVVREGRRFVATMAALPAR